MNHLMLTLATITSAMTVGFIPVLVDHFKSHWIEQFKATEERALRWNWWFFLAWLPGMPFAGWVFDHYFTKELLFFGLFLCVLASVSAVMATTPIRVKLSLLALGLAYSMVAVSCIWELPIAFDFREQTSYVAALNLGFIFVVLGAMVGLYGLRALERRLGFTRAYLYISFLFFVPTLLTAMAPRSDFERLSLDILSWTDLFNDPFLCLLLVLMVLYFAMENCMDIWPPRYLQEIGYAPATVPWITASFWLAFLAGRLVMGLFAIPTLDVWILMLLALATAVTVGNLTGAQDRTPATFGYLLTGFCYGPLLPGFLGLVMEITEKASGGKPSASALGCLLCLSGLDTVIFQRLVNAFAKNWQARTFMRIPAILALPMIGILLILALMAISPTGGGRRKTSELERPQEPRHMHASSMPRAGTQA